MKRCITYGGSILATLIVMIMAALLIFMVGFPKNIVGMVVGATSFVLMIWWWISMYKTVKGTCDTYNIDGLVFKNKENDE